MSQCKTCGNWYGKFVYRSEQHGLISLCHWCRDKVEEIWLECVYMNKDLNMSLTNDQLKEMIERRFVNWRIGKDVLEWRFNQPIKVKNTEMEMDKLVC